MKSAFYLADIHSQDEIEALILEKGIEAIVHLAASIEIEESVYSPGKYQFNNYEGTRRLVAAALKTGVKSFLFASTCSVYGESKEDFLSEESPTSPLSPYAESKAHCEQLLLKAAQEHSDFKVGIIRCFNVAGAHLDASDLTPSFRVGQMTRRASLLIHVAARASCGIEPYVSLRGVDYPTSDGTCIRDFVHVDDVAELFALTLLSLSLDRRNLVLNCGSGQGHSVSEILSLFSEVSRVRLRIINSGRRPGDPSRLVANITRAQQELSWTPRRSNSKIICQSSFLWEQFHSLGIQHDRTAQISMEKASSPYN